MTTQEAAEDLGYTIQHTRLLIRRGQIEATKFGRDWMVVRESVIEYKTSQENREETDE
jgi:excisionase family DNA binding protein